MSTSSNRPPASVPGPAVSAEWLAANLGRPGLVILDGSWYLPGSGRDPAREFEARRIPGARFFDIDACSDPDAELPHTVPPPDHFRKCAEAAGVSDTSGVVVYDGSGVNLSAARVWWTFRYFGLDSVAVLDGGLKHWIAAGLPTESGPPVRTLEAPAPFTPRPGPTSSAPPKMSSRRSALLTPRSWTCDRRAASREPSRNPGQGSGPATCPVAATSRTPISWTHAPVS